MGKQISALARAIGQIENIHVDNVRLNSGVYALGWSKAGDRYHVWYYPDDGFSKTIHKNPAITVQRGAAGHFETRSLNRNSNAQAPIFDYVLSVVTAGELVAKAFEKARRREFCERRGNELQHAIDNLERDALQAFRDGRYSSNDGTLHQLYADWRQTSEELALVRKEAA